MEKVDLPEPLPQQPQRIQDKTPASLPFAQWMKEQEKKYLIQQLAAFHGRLEETAENSGMCVRTLFRKMRMYGLDKKQFRRPNTGDLGAQLDPESWANAVAAPRIASPQPNDARGRTVVR
jgi:hypothetical protein